MITCKDIAQIAGVSTATVTRAFNTSSSIKEDTRQRILQIAKEHNYTPNLAARGLRQRMNKIVGIIVPDASNPYYVKVAQYIERRLDYHGFRSLISFAERSISRSLDVMQVSRVDGVIFKPDEGTPPEMIHAMQRQGTQFVQIYRHSFPNIDCVLNDNLQGAYIGTKHLMDCGHRRILFAHRETDMRVDGFWQAVEEKPEIKASCDAVVFDSNDIKNRADLKEAFERIKPSAIFAATHVVALSVFHHLWNMGYRIPEDVSLLVNDNLDWCETMNISVIKHPCEVLANAATDMLISRIQQTAPEQVQKQIIAPYLICRDSVRRL